jgi:hypothetical protein
MLEAHKDGAFIFEKKILRKACMATLSQTTQIVSPWKQSVALKLTISGPSTSDYSFNKYSSERTRAQSIPPPTTSICSYSLIGLKSVAGTSFEVLPLHEAPAN